MLAKLRLALSLFRASWLRTLITIVGIGATVSLVGAVLLVQYAFTTSADEQLDGIYSEYSVVVQSPTGEPIPQPILTEVLAAEGIDTAVPVGQYETRIQGTPAALVTLPIEAEDAGELDELQSDAVPVAMSEPLQSRLGLAVGDHTTIVTPLGSMGVVLVPIPDGDEQERLNRSTYVVASAATLLQAGEVAGLAQPNLVLVKLAADADDAALREVVAANSPGVELQDRTQARAAMLAGLRSLLQTLPLVALIAISLSAVLVFAIIRTSTIAQLRSLTMLRALGASSCQLMGLAVISALVHSVLGALLGIGLSKGLADGLLDSIPVSIRNSSAQVLKIDYVPTISLAVLVSVAIIGAAAAWFALKPALNSSVEDRLRDPGEARRRAGSVVLFLALGVVFAAIGIAIVLIKPRELWFVSSIAILIAWLLVSMVAVPLLLRVFDRASRRSRAGWVGTSGGTPPGQLQASALVMSATLAMLVALAGAGENLQLSAYPTQRGMDQIDLLVEQVSVDDVPTLHTLTAATMTQVAQVDGVDQVKPIQMGYMSLLGSRVLVQGVSPDSLLPVVVEGRDAYGELSPGEVYISTQFAADHNLAAGDSFEILARDGGTVQLAVLGPVTSFLWPNGLIVMDVTDTEQVWGARTYSSFEIVTNDRAGVRQRLLQAGGQFDDADTVVVTGEELAAAAWQVTKDSVGLYQTLSMVAFFVGILVAGGALALDTATRLREYGTVRAVGARNRFLAAMVLNRAAVLVGAGTVIGWAFGIVLQYYFAVTSASTQSLPITMHWTLTPTLTAVMAGAAVLIVASLGSILRIQRASAPSMLGAPD